MHVLVTGGAGFIGSHVVDHLRGRGDQVTVLDSLVTGDERRVADGVPLLRRDIRDPGLGEVLKTEQVDAIVHLAAQIDVRISVDDPGEDADVNVRGTITVAQAAVRAGVGTLVFSSSGGAIYGEQQHFPADEGHPTAPCSPYGCAKLAGEKYLAYFAMEYGLRTRSMRFANVYGPRQDGRGEAGVVGIFCRTILDGGTPRIFGDGEQTRDYVFVDDVARATVAALGPAPRREYNVGTGIETDVNTLYEHIARELAFERPAAREAGMPGEQRRSVIDASALRRDITLPPFVPLAEGIRRTVAWFQAGSIR